MILVLLGKNFKEGKDDTEEEKSCFFSLFFTSDFTWKARLRNENLFVLFFIGEWDLFFLLLVVFLIFDVLFSGSLIAFGIFKIEFDIQANKFKMKKFETAKVNKT